MLKVLDLSPVSGSATGRYLRSLPIAPGVRYWATSQPRHRRDFFGVQFYGEGTAEARRCAERLQAAGFQARTPQTGQLTYAKSVAFAPRGGVDADSLRAARRELDAILRSLRDEHAPDRKPNSFRRLMLESPLAGVELSLPPRAPAWRSGDL